MKPLEEQTLVEKLRNRAAIRRQASSRKSVQNNEPDRLSDLLEEAADRIEELEIEGEVVVTRQDEEGRILKVIVEPQKREEVQRRIVCAANMDEETGYVILGARHWDNWMHRAYDSWKQATGYNQRHPRFKKQGFIDNLGYFLNRVEAWKVAEAAGQIRQTFGGNEVKGGTLYSENLY